MLIDTDKPLLLIDLGYAMFYRYSATQVWYKHSHPEEKADLSKDYKWHENSEFVEKMKKMFVVDILQLAKKYKIPKTNIIIAEDCHLKDNWRSAIFSDYKAQRSEEREKNGWQGGHSFEIIYKEAIPELVNVHGVIHLKHPKIEADDIISQIVIKCLNTSDKSKVPTKFVIVASDNDYFQILEDNVELINMKGVSQKDKMKMTPKAHLMEKILKGDVSDNISSCLFNKKLLSELVPGSTKATDKAKSVEQFIKTNKKILDYYLEHLEQLEKDYGTYGEKYIEGFATNKKLIDFSELPSEYIKDVEKLFVLE
jgi:5'-3' exonuclease